MLANNSIEITPPSYVNYSAVCSHWPFGQAYCKIVQFVSVLSVSASIFTLVAISIDRSVLFTDAKVNPGGCIATL